MLNSILFKHFKTVGQVTPLCRENWWHRCAIITQAMLSVGAKNQLKWIRRAHRRETHWKWASLFFHSTLWNLARSWHFPCLRTRETLNLLMCADSCTDTKTDKNQTKKMKKKEKKLRKMYFSCVTCQVSHVTWHVSGVMCHLYPGLF